MATAASWASSASPARRRPDGGVGRRLAAGGPALSARSWRRRGQGGRQVVGPLEVGVAAAARRSRPAPRPRPSRSTPARSSRGAWSARRRRRRRRRSSAEREQERRSRGRGRRRRARPGRSASDEVARRQGVGGVARPIRCWIPAASRRSSGAAPIEAWSAIPRGSPRGVVVRGRRLRPVRVAGAGLLLGARRCSSRRSGRRDPGSARRAPTPRPGCRPRARRGRTRRARGTARARRGPRRRG